MKTKEWRISIKPAGIIASRIGVTHFIYITEPRGGEYVFHRNQTRKTTWVMDHSPNVKAYSKAVQLAESIQPKEEEIHAPQTL